MWSTVPRACQRALSSGQCTGLLVGRPGFLSWPGQGVVPFRRAEKKMRAPLLGLAKSIYLLLFDFRIFFSVSSVWHPVFSPGLHRQTLYWGRYCRRSSLSRKFRWATLLNQPLCVDVFFPNDFLIITSSMFWWRRHNSDITSWLTTIYIIIQIVRALWLAIKPFYMRVCKHGFRSSFISYFIKEM